MRAIANGLLLSGFFWVLVCAVIAVNGGHLKAALGFVVVEALLAWAISRRYEFEEVDPWEGQ